MDASELQLQRLLRTALHLAEDVARAEESKRRRGKGINSDPEKIIRWVKRNLAAKRRAVLLRALRGTAAHRDEPAEHLRQAVLLLCNDLRIAVRGRGRPSRGQMANDKPIGMLRSVSAHSAGTREPLPSIDPLPWIYGLKLAIYRAERGYADSTSQQQMLQRLRLDLQGAGAPVDVGSRLELAALLDSSVPDLRAAKHPRALQRFGQKPGTLAKQIQRARKKSRFAIPASAQ